MSNSRKGNKAKNLNVRKTNYNNQQAGKKGVIAIIGDLFKMGYWGFMLEREASQNHPQWLDWLQQHASQDHQHWIDWLMRMWN